MRNVIVILIVILSASKSQAHGCTKAILAKLTGQFVTTSRFCSGVYGLDYCGEGWSAATEDQAYAIDTVKSVESKKGLGLVVTLSSAKTKSKTPLKDREFTFLASNKEVHCVEKNGSFNVMLKSPTAEVKLENDERDAETFHFSNILQVQHEGRTKTVTMELGLHRK